MKINMINEHQAIDALHNLSIHKPFTHSKNTFALWHSSMYYMAITYIAQKIYSTVSRLYKK